MNDWSIYVRSQDRMSGNVGAFSVMIPSVIPTGRYRARVAWAMPSATSVTTSVYALEVKGPGITRFVNTSVTCPDMTKRETDPWCLAGIAHGTGNNAKGTTFYMDGPPTLLNFRIRRMSDNVIVANANLAGEYGIGINLERLDPPKTPGN